MKVVGIAVDPSSDSPASDSAPTPRRQPGATWPLDYEGEFNFPAALLAVASIMGGAAVYGLLTGEHSTGSATFLTVLGLLLGAPCGLLVFEQWQDIRFRRWVLANWNDIVEGHARLDGIVVQPQTEFVTYTVVVSAVLLHTQTYTRPVIRGSVAERRMRWLSSLITACLGWCFLLRGPVVTVLALRDNLSRGGTSLPLSSIATATVQGRSLMEIISEA